MAKSQIIHIHGGNPFDSREQYISYIQNWYNPLKEKKSWARWIYDELGFSVEMYLPWMPAKENAEYEIWKIAFEKIFPVLSDAPVILTGKSLGTIFLVKYLSENSPPFSILSLHLVGLVFDGEGIEDEWVADFILTIEKLKNVTKQVKNIHLYHSRDDDCCPWHNVEKYMKHFPEASLHEFSDRGHFGQEDFPELLGEIRSEL